MKQYDHLLDSLERKYNGEGKIFPVKRHRCLMSCYYCELYTMKGNSGKAQAYLDQATAYLDSSFGDRVEAQYLRTKSFYYWKEKDYRHALSAVNLALKINRDLDKLEMKKRYCNRPANCKRRSLSMRRSSIRRRRSTWMPSTGKSSNSVY